MADELPDSDPQKATLLKFRKDYEAFTGKPVNTFAGHAFDSLQMVLQAIRKAGDDRAAIRDALEQTKDFVGITGVFNLSPEDHNGLTKDAFALVVIKNGTWTQIK